MALINMEEEGKQEGEPGKGDHHLGDDERMKREV